jgi:hypothetical protein
MRFSNILPAAAGLVGLASATLGHLPIVSDLVKGTDRVVKPVCDLAHHWEDDVLFKGDVSADVSLDLRLIQAAVAGEVGIDVSAKFLQKPALRLSLAGVKAFVQLDLSASASIYESVELFATPELSVDLLDILEIDIKALFALDLVIGCSAAIDVSAGVYVSFSEDAYIDIDLIKRDVLDVNLANPSIEALPLAIGANVDLAAAVDLSIGLRLRSYIALEADIDIIGIDLLEAGAEVAIYVNLFDYTTTLIDGSGDCVVSVSKDIALTLGLAVRLNVSILELIDVSLTPNVFLTLATVAEAEICMPDRGEFPDGSELIEDGDNEDGDSDNGNGSEDGEGESDNGNGDSDSGNGSDNGEDSDESPEGSIETPEGSFETPSPAVTGAPAVTPPPAVTETPAPGGNGTVHTSTESITTTYTITKCEIDVVNCPANKKTIIVHSTVYKCPATKTKVPHVPEITKTSVMTPCPTPTTVTVTEPEKPTATPEKPEGEKPEKPEKPETPEETKTPEAPEETETPEAPEEPETPEKPETPEEPEEPEEPETPETPEEPVCPGSPECPEETVVQPPPAQTEGVTPPVSTPTAPAEAGAGSLTVGMASVFLGAVIAVMV